jgi:hypothetical protein
VNDPRSSDEARVLARVWDWASQATGPIDAADIARRASTAPHVRGWRALGSSRAFVLAALVLLALALALGVAAAILLRTTQPDAYRAVVLRQDGAAVTVLLVDADGHERILRRLTPERLGIEPGSTLDAYGTVGEQGWLEIGTSSRDALGSPPSRYGFSILVDLADPAAAPIIVPSNGFMSGRWGPRGLWAHYDEGNISGGSVHVFDPDRGADSAITVSGVQTFGGNPSIVWAADGSGFLARSGDGWGVKPLDGGPFVPGIPDISERWLGPIPLGAAVPTDLGSPGISRGADEHYEGQLQLTVPVATQFSSDGLAIWQLFDDPDGTSDRALMVRLTGPDEVGSVHGFEVPSGPVIGFRLSPDDGFAAIDVGGFDADRFVLVPTGPGAAVVATGPVVEGRVAGLVPAAAADLWPSP